MLTILSETWNRRDLIRELVVKDLKLRYSRPMLGFVWAFILPFVMTLVFCLFFSVIMKMQVKEAPYLVYLMSGIFPWRFFQDSLTTATSSLMDNKNLLREARFPPYFIPVSVVLANAISFLPSLAIIVVLGLLLTEGIPLFVLLLPLILIMHALVTGAFAVVLSLVYLRWRDMKFALELVLFFLFYLSPSFYSMSLVKTAMPPWALALFVFSPFTCILNLYRVTLLNGFSGYLAQFMSLGVLAGVSLLFTVGVTLFSVYFYKAREKTIYDSLSY
ncbi:MAG: ABC transporter permease [Candidatus Omnitrophica bacterium]|nr:ABC transporter permease [Candidatus Omnitrophota bacterium]